jgi:hypothetical protein
MQTQLTPFECYNVLGIRAKISERKNIKERELSFRPFGVSSLWQLGQKNQRAKTPTM